MVRLFFAFGPPPGFEAWRLLELRGALAISGVIDHVVQSSSPLEGCLYIPPQQNCIIIDVNTSVSLKKICNRLTLGKFAGFPLSAIHSSFSAAIAELAARPTALTDAIRDLKASDAQTSFDSTTPTWAVRFITHGASRSSDDQRAHIAAAADAFRGAAAAAEFPIGAVNCRNPDIVLVIYEEARGEDADALRTAAEQRTLAAAAPLVDIPSTTTATATATTGVSTTTTAGTTAPGTSRWTLTLLGDGCDTARARAVALSLKKRAYIGNSTLPPDVSLVMVTAAEVTTSSIVYDPFCGTAGTLVAAAAVGAETVGGEVDYKTLRVGTACRSAPRKAAKAAAAATAAAAVAAAAAADGGRQGGNAVEVNFTQAGLRGPDLLLVDAAPAPISRPWPFRVGTAACGARGAPGAVGGGKGAAEWFDAVVSDPPYGIREQHSMVDRVRIARKGLIDGGAARAAAAAARAAAAAAGCAAEGLESADAESVTNGSDATCEASAEAVGADAADRGTTAPHNTGAAAEEGTDAATPTDPSSPAEPLRALVPPKASAPLASLLASVVATIAVTLRVGGVAALLLPIATGAWPDGPMENEAMWGDAQQTLGGLQAGGADAPSTLHPLSPGGRSAPKLYDPNVFGALVAPLRWESVAPTVASADATITSSGTVATATTTAASAPTPASTTTSSSSPLLSFAAAAAAWRASLHAVLPLHPCLSVEAAAPQQLSTRLQRRLVLLRKVRPYDHSSAADVAPVPVPAALLVPPTASADCPDVATEGGAHAKSAYNDYKERRRRVWENSARHQAAAGVGPRTAKAAKQAAAAGAGLGAGVAADGGDSVMTTTTTTTTAVTTAAATSPKAE